MSNILNVGLMQSRGHEGIVESLERIERTVETLMEGLNKPDIICGVEMGIGMYLTDGGRQSFDTVPGVATEKLSALAKKHSVYLVPGSMTESVDVEGEAVYYNTIPIFSPEGKLINKYRKMSPYYPLEEKSRMGGEYVVFDIPEKDAKIGIMNCHDWCFPEVSRNLTMMGAEILIRPAVDPEGLYGICKNIAPARAFENQAFFISLNMAGEFFGCKAYGKSMVCAPDARVIYEAGETETFLTLPLDIDEVKNARRYGTNYTDQLLRQLKHFDHKLIYNDDIGKAPIYKTLPDADLTMVDRFKDLRENNIIK